MTRFGLVTIVIFALFSQLTLNAATYRATSSGAWNDARRWAPEGVPGAGDYAFLNGHNINLATLVQVAGFKLEGGLLGIGGATVVLTLTDSATWTDGTIVGGGTLTVASGARLIINGNAAGQYAYLKQGTTLINHGTIRQTGSSNIYGQGNVIIDNRGLFEQASGGDFDGESFSGGTFVNSGTFRKTGGSDTTLFNFWWTFQNKGGLSMSVPARCTWAGMAFSREEPTTLLPARA